MIQRGIDVSYEAIRMWTWKFGQIFAYNLRKSRVAPSARWHLDEMVVRIAGLRMFLWRAVDDEDEVMDMLVQKRRNKAAALKLLRKLRILKYADEIGSTVKAISDVFSTIVSLE